MFSDYDLIFLALPRWDGPYSSTAYSLAKALSKHTRVFYVDNPFTIKDFLVHRRSSQVVLRRNALLRGKDLFLSPDKKNHPNLVAVTPRLTLPINWLPAGLLYDALSRINDYAITMALNEALREYGIKQYVLINSFNPLYGRFLRLKVKPAMTIYQSVDDISHSEYVNRHGPRLEKEYIHKADFTIVTSSELQRLKSAISDNVYLLPNAADTQIFNTAFTEDLEVPDEMKAFGNKKVICYMGNICHRLDYELLIEVATRHADKILLMVGPFANERFKTSGLASLPNVRFTGRKIISELAPYLKYSHCCIIPFLCNELTKSIYPLKINEYLAAGKPVVSTNFSHDIASFSQVAYVSDAHEDFVSNIDLAINGDSPEKAAERVLFSSGNTWESRARDFMTLMGRYVGERDVTVKVKRKAGIQPLSH